MIPKRDRIGETDSRRLMAGFALLSKLEHFKVVKWFTEETNCCRTWNRFFLRVTVLKMFTLDHPLLSYDLSENIARFLHVNTVSDFNLNLRGPSDGNDVMEPLIRSLGFFKTLELDLPNVGDEGYLALADNLHTATSMSTLTLKWDNRSQSLSAETEQKLRDKCREGKIDLRLESSVISSITID